MLNKILKTAISALLAGVILLSAVGCAKGNDSSDTTASEDIIPTDLKIDISNNVEGSPIVERAYTGLYSDSDNQMYQNPNRGLRGYLDFFEFSVSDEELENQIKKYSDIFDKYTQSTTYVLYLYPGEYRGKHLGEDFYKTTQKIFDWCRERKIQILLRFAYFAEGVYNDRTPTTDELMMHINDLAENGIIERNKDIIHVFQAGFIGKYGEWHSDNPPADRSLIFNTFMNKLLPKDVYVQVRQPDYKDYISDDNPLKKMIGFNNDGWFGIQDTTQLGNQGFSYGLPAWERAVSEAAYTPQDGELYFSQELQNKNGQYPDGYACILGCSQLRFTTLSAMNGYLDQGAMKDGAMVRWMNQPVTIKWLEEYGLPYTENWFYNNKGEMVERNAFEYIRDYLGYRLSADTLSVKSAAGDSIKAELKLENHGFSAAFNISSKLVILDSKGSEISAVDAGNPTEWHPTDPENYKNREQLVHTLSAEFKLPKEEGEYKLALRLESKGGGTARLDNNIPFEQGYNILHTFKIG